MLSSTKSSDWLIWSLHNQWYYSAVHLDPSSWRLPSNQARIAWRLSGSTRLVAPEPTRLYERWSEELEPIDKKLIMWSSQWRLQWSSQCELHTTNKVNIASEHDKRIWQANIATICVTISDITISDRELETKKSYQFSKCLKTIA